MGTKVGYARVSTRDQSDDSQTDALTEAGCEKIFQDKASGKLASRPEWDKCLEYLRPGDSLVITRLSRAGRSLRNLLDIAADLDRRGINLVVLKQQIDTTTPAGRLVFHFMAALDEFQRELIVEGTREGLAAAMARGAKPGRKVKMTPEKDALARRLIDEGQMAAGDIAALIGVHRTTLHKHLGATGLTGAATPKLTPDGVSRIKRRLAEDDSPAAIAALAEEHDVHPLTISHIKAGRTWRDVEAAAS